MAHGLTGGLTAVDTDIHTVTDEYTNQYADPDLYAVADQYADQHAHQYADRNPKPDSDSDPGHSWSGME